LAAPPELYPFPNVGREGAIRSLYGVFVAAAIVYVLRKHRSGVIHEEAVIPGHVAMISKPWHSVLTSLNIGSFGGAPNLLLP
jgi:hypothetical protein